MDSESYMWALSVGTQAPQAIVRIFGEFDFKIVYMERYDFAMQVRLLFPRPDI
jgi:hypothetical protein